MTLNIRRRALLRGALAVGPALLYAPMSRARDVSGWPAKQFHMVSADDLLAALGGNEASDSPRINITAPKLAQNGATVPVTVGTDIKDVELISLVVPKNPFPLVAKYRIAQGTDPYVVNRIRMKKSDDVVVLVRTRDGKVYRGSTHIKVTVGGCGG